MGLFEFIKNELIDVIEWLDDSNDTLVWRYPDRDHAIKMGAKLTVREGQAAIFVNEGEVADVFGPGLYTLSTQNLPILTKLKSWKYGFDSPFKAEVYFVNTKQYLDRKWGTSQPIMLRDKDFGAVRLRAFGIYAIRVTDPRTFWREFVGTKGLFTTKEIEGQIRRTIVANFAAALGELQVPALDLAANYLTVAEKIRVRLDEECQKDGYSLTKLLVENISLPEKLQQALDERGTMGILGDMGRFTQYQAALAMRDAAKNPSGVMGAPMGLGAGVAMGQMMMGNMAQAMPGYAYPPQPPAPAPAPPPQPAPPAEPAGPSLAERLKKLKDLHAAGLIDDATFAAKRDAILAEI